MKRISALTYLHTMPVIMFFFVITGCSESPKGKYTSLCMKFAATDEQRESCKCMAREYDKVLDKQEFQAITDIMERATKELSKPGVDAFNMPGFVDYEGIDKQVLVSAIQKMKPLHQAKVCGYVSR